MELILIILLFLLGGLWETEAVPVTGVSGDGITIKCSHANAFSNVKYFCRGACKNEDILISSRKNKNNSNEKYSIRDEGNTFYVTISHLTKDDSGTYWCGIERTGIDTYNEVVLTVIEGNTKIFNDSPQSNSNEAIKTKTSKKLMYIGAGLGVVVLVLAMVFLIFLRHRNRDISASSGKVHDTVYATPSTLKEGAHHITTSSSTDNEDQRTDGGTNNIFDTSRDHTDNIYCNVTISSESEIQPESLFYSVISFNEHTDCSTVTPPPAAVTYSTVNYKSTDESTIYCDV